MEYGPAPEDPKEALAWLDVHGRRFGHFIDGAWRQPVEAGYFETADPSTGEKLATVAQGSAADIDAAVRAASAALPKWQALTPHARARYLYALARTVQKHSRRLAVLETMDNGKPIRESRDIDIPLVVRHFYHHAGWAQLLHQEFPGYEACGVVGQIIPWNFPLLMLAWKIAPALATGNTVVLKPAEFTPLTALAFAEICSEIGLPPRRGQHRHRRRFDRRSAGQASRRGQDRVHRLDRGGTRHPQRHGSQPQAALARTGGQVAIHHLRRRRPRQRGRRSGRRHLVQSGTGLLRGLAPADAGEHRGAADRESS